LRLKKASTRKKLNPLVTVPVEKGFHFFSDIGEYTGETATNLLSFVEMIKVADPKSLEFHFRRHDFQKWIKDTIGDMELAARIDALKENLPDEELRRRLVEIVEKRVRGARHLELEYS
jgi:hypothetical protein